MKTGKLRRKKYRFLVRMQKIWRIKSKMSRKVNHNPLKTINKTAWTKTHSKRSSWIKMKNQSKCLRTETQKWIIHHQFPQNHQQKKRLRKLHKRIRMTPKIKTTTTNKNKNNLRKMTMRINKKKEKGMKKMKTRNLNMRKKTLKTFLISSPSTTERINYTTTPINLWHALLRSSLVRVKRWISVFRRQPLRLFSCHDRTN